jgi:hypothetical protein
MGKMKTNLEIYQSIRKSTIPPSRIERPIKGRGFKRHDKYKKDRYDEQ